MMIVCTEEEDYIKKSQVEKKLVEEKLGIKNVSSGFPLLPVFTENKDVLVQQTCNLGLLPFLSTRIVSNTANSSNAATSASNTKGIADFKFQDGFPWNLVNIGNRLDIKESKNPPNRVIEVRKIVVIRNDKLSSPSSTPTEEEVISTIIHAPTVSDIPWKKLSVDLSKKYSRQKEKILSQITVPREELDQEVYKILLNPANNEILKYFNTIRQQVNNLNNPAYVEAFIYGTTSYMSLHHWISIFPRVYAIGRGQEVTCKISDPQVGLMWKEYIMTQYTESYYNDMLVMHSELNLEVLMAHLFQIVFGLDYAQRTIGFIHHNLDIRNAIGYIKMDKCIYLQYKWHDKYYMVPSYGQMLKLKNLNNSSILIDGVLHSASKQQQQEEDSDSCSYNTDLVRLGATLKKVIQEKQLKTYSPDPYIDATFNKMIDKWINCGNILAERKFPSAKEVAMQESRLKCLQTDALDEVTGQCEWKKFGEMPNHTECRSAVPYTQQEFFKMFRVEESEINKDALIYTIG